LGRGIMSELGAPKALASECDCAYSMSSTLLLQVTLLYTPVFTRTHKLTLSHVLTLALVELVILACLPDCRVDGVVTNAYLCTHE